MMKANQMTILLMLRILQPVGDRLSAPYKQYRQYDGRGQAGNGSRRKSPAHIFIAGSVAEESRLQAVGEQHQQQRRPGIVHIRHHATIPCMNTWEVGRQNDEAAGQLRMLLCPVYGGLAGISFE